MAVYSHHLSCDVLHFIYFMCRTERDGEKEHITMRLSGELHQYGNPFILASSPVASASVELRAQWSSPGGGCVTPVGHH